MRGGLTKAVRCRQRDYKKDKEKVAERSGFGLQNSLGEFAS